MATAQFLLVDQWKQGVGTEKYALQLPMTSAHLATILATKRENSIECKIVEADLIEYMRKLELCESYNYSLADHVLAGGYSTVVRRFDEIENPTEHDIASLLNF